LEVEFVQKKVDWDYYGKPDEDTKMYQYEKVRAKQCTK